MNFFQHQEQARRRTWFLVFLYLVSVVAIVGGTYVFFVVAWKLGMQRDAGHVGVLDGLESGGLWHPELFFWVTGITLCIVVGGSLIRILQLAKGGEAVARLLGGRLISPLTSDLDEKKILNVVEEMAIAAGLPVPRVFLLEQEEAINAFAAGYSPKDAVIGVSAGCIRELNRDELQGVIAHEFSHILNGDMRLNIKLLGLLSGILMIALSGAAISKHSLSSMYYGRRRRDDSSKGFAFLVLFGFFLYVLGYVGAFFAHLIQCAVSRQREFLADASAVQFTRNPAGIAGALKKILNYSKGSALKHPAAEELSHFYFASGVQSFLFTLCATHPPLVERIKRVDPRFREELINESRVQPAQRPSLSSFVGTVGSAQLAFAHEKLAGIPPVLEAMVHSDSGARGVVFVLLLNREPEVRKRQLQYLQAECDMLLWDELSRALPLVEQVEEQFRLPLAHTCLPALKTLSPEDYRRFRLCAQHLVETDELCTVFEYALQRMLRRNLDSKYFKVDSPTRARKPDWVPAALQLVHALSILSYGSGTRAQAAFGAASQLLGDNRAKLPSEAGNLQLLDQALYALESTGLPHRQKVLEACLVCVSFDHQISVSESELIRAIADGLDLPIPPLTLV